MDYILTMLVTWAVVMIRYYKLPDRIISEHPLLAFLLLTYFIASVISPISYLVYKLITSFLSKE